LGRLLGLGSAPLRSSRPMDRSRLVGLRVHVLWDRCIALIRGTSRGLAILEELKTRLDVDIGRIEIGGTLIGVERVGGLVVAGLVLSHG